MVIKNAFFKINFQMSVVYIKYIDFNINRVVVRESGL